MDAFAAIEAAVGQFGFVHKRYETLPSSKRYWNCSDLTSRSKTDKSLHEYLKKISNHVGLSDELSLFDWISSLHPTSEYLEDSTSEFVGNNQVYASCKNDYPLPYFGLCTRFLIRKLFRETETEKDDNILRKAGCFRKLSSSWDNITSNNLVKIISLMKFVNKLGSSRIEIPSVLPTVPNKEKMLFNPHSLIPLCHFRSGMVLERSRISECNLMKVNLSIFVIIIVF